jgi:hypothetical protein
MSTPQKIAVKGQLLPRVVALSAWLAALLPLVALVAFLGAYRVELDRLADLPSIVGDRGAAPTLRLAGLLDMSAYLAVAPVVLHLHRRLRERAPDLMGLVTFAGLAYLLLGSLGGTLLATVGPPLVEDGSEAARVTFGAFATMVTVTLWGTLESIFLGVWLIGVGSLIRAERYWFGMLAIVAGVGALLSAARSGITGRSVGDLPGPVDVVVVGLLGLYVPWLVWLGMLVYRRQVLGSKGA